VEDWQRDANVGDCSWVAVMLYNENLSDHLVLSKNK
jgi:hypothetical protein